MSPIEGDKDFQHLAESAYAKPIMRIAALNAKLTNENGAATMYDSQGFAESLVQLRNGFLLPLIRRSAIADWKGAKRGEHQRSTYINIRAGIAKDCHCIVQQLRQARQIIVNNQRHNKFDLSFARRVRFDTRIRQRMANHCWIDVWSKALDDMPSAKGLND